MKVKRWLTRLLLLGLLGSMFAVTPVMAARRFDPSVNPSPVLSNRNDDDDDDDNDNDYSDETNDGLIQNGAIISPQTGDSRPMPIYLLALGALFASTAVAAGSYLKKEQF